MKHMVMYTKAIMYAQEIILFFNNVMHVNKKKKIKKHTSII
jgi:hypothetical protein